MAGRLLEETNCGEMIRLRSIVASRLEPKSRREMEDAARIAYTASHRGGKEGRGGDTGRRGETGTMGVCVGRRRGRGGGTGGGRMGRGRTERKGSDETLQS